MRKEYEDVGLEAAYLPHDLKHYGVRSWTREDVWGAILGVVGASIFVGYVIGFIVGRFPQ